jgi:DNA-binding NtrC family response regulator
MNRGKKPTGAGVRLTSAANEQTMELAAARLSAAHAGNRLLLVVANERVLVTKQLPAKGSVVVGRGDAADVQVDDAALSRLHFAIHLGERVGLEDLGSSNGTRLRNELLAPRRRADCGPGDLVEAGATTFMLRWASGSRRPRRFIDRDYFGLRVEEEAVRASQSGQGFAVVRLSMALGTSPQSAEAVLADAVRPTDILGRYGPAGEYEVLFPGVDANRAEDLARDLVSVLSDGGIDARHGLAIYPQDHASPEAIVALASTRVRGLDAASPTDDGVLLGGAAMREVQALVERVATGTISILLLGETGSGKEVLTEEIHARSRRSDRPLVRVNCAALSEELLASELFGHVRGAFTGAVTDKQGLMETADGGTLFLDEVGEISPSVQAKLLRALDSHTVVPVGGVSPRYVDVRFVAATNRALEEDVRIGRFREDLYYRLAGVTVTVPPLRERRDEIIPLARLFASKACRRDGIEPVPAFAPETLDRLHAHDWPGNIRELRNLVERAVLLCSDGVVRPEHLLLDRTPTSTPAFLGDDAMASALATESTFPIPARGRADESTRPVDAMRRRGPDAERQAILGALAACDGNQTRAARTLGISRGTLIKRLEAYGIERPRKGR